MHEKKTLQNCNEHSRFLKQPLCFTVSILNNNEDENLLKKILAVKARV